MVPMNFSPPESPFLLYPFRLREGTLLLNEGLVSGGLAPSGLGAGVDGTATPSSAPEPNTVGTFVTWDRTLPTAREATLIEKAARASQAAESRRGDRISIFLLSSSTEEINHG